MVTQYITKRFRLGYDLVEGKVQFKKCRKCNILKNISNFHIYNNKLTDWCITCFVDYSDNHYPNKYEEYALPIKYTLSHPKEMYFLYGNSYSCRSDGKRMSSPGFLSRDITGICSICGEPILFGVSHHILGDQNEFTVMLCNECHLTDGNTDTNYHCKSIGGKIEFGALCWS